MNLRMTKERKLRAEKSMALELGLVSDSVFSNPLLSQLIYQYLPFEDKKSLLTLTRSWYRANLNSFLQSSYVFFRCIKKAEIYLELISDVDERGLFWEAPPAHSEFRFHRCINLSSIMSLAVFNGSVPGNETLRIEQIASNLMEADDEGIILMQLFFVLKDQIQVLEGSFRASHPGSVLKLRYGLKLLKNLKELRLTAHRINDFTQSSTDKFILSSSPLMQLDLNNPGADNVFPSPPPSPSPPPPPSPAPSPPPSPTPSRPSSPSSRSGSCILEPAVIYESLSLPQLKKLQYVIHCEKSESVDIPYAMQLLSQSRLLLWNILLLIGFPNLEEYHLSPYDSLSPDAIYDIRLMNTFLAIPAHASSHQSIVRDLFYMKFMKVLKVELTTKMIVNCLRQIHSLEHLELHNCDFFDDAEDVSFESSLMPHSTSLKSFILGLNLQKLFQPLQDEEQEGNNNWNEEFDFEEDDFMNEDNPLEPGMLRTEFEMNLKLPTMEQLQSLEIRFSIDMEYIHTLSFYLLNATLEFKNIPFNYCKMFPKLNTLKILTDIPDNREYDGFVEQINNSFIQSCSRKGSSSITEIYITRHFQEDDIKAKEVFENRVARNFPRAKGVNFEQRLGAF